ncbi:transposase [Vibrio parahaemolyticus]|nr:transposase [Vibrio parahaemolyticus]
MKKALLHFQNSRQFSAWCGFFPKQNSPGGKVSRRFIEKLVIVN